MFTKQDIINSALVKIGNSPQNEITETYLNTTYTIGKKFLLGQHYWSFAKVVNDLSLVADIKYLNWNYTYRLPLNVGCVFDIFPHAKYDIFGSYLVCNNNPIQLIYSANDVEDLFPPAFSMLFATWIAREVSIIIKADQSLITMLTASYQEMLLNAISLDSFNVSSYEFRSNRYIDIR